MLYAITSRGSYGFAEVERRHRLLELVTLWATNCVEFIQLREKDLPARDQVELARAIMAILRTTQKPSGMPCQTRLLINGRADVALASNADGVHLPRARDHLTPDEVHSIFATAAPARIPIVSVSCHSLEEVEAARRQSADCILFAPVFEKVIPVEWANSVKIEDSDKAKILPGVGLATLKQACQIARPVPVFALGGVTEENASQCLHAGAAGIAAIRLMQKPASTWVKLAS